jgi:hypothetical protein
VSLNYEKDLISDNFNELGHTIIKLFFLVSFWHSNEELTNGRIPLRLTIFITPFAFKQAPPNSQTE